MYSATNFKILPLENATVVMKGESCTTPPEESSWPLSEWTDCIKTIRSTILDLEDPMRWAEEQD
jgi:hypothetical protein